MRFNSRFLEFVNACILKLVYILLNVKNGNLIDFSVLSVNM